jgi:thiamine biosynthesis lipoprotein
MKPSRSNRREFLQGKAAARAISDAAQNLPLPEPTAGSAGGANSAGQPAVIGLAPQSYLLRIGRRAMACEFEVLLGAGPDSDGTEFAVAALDLVDRLESQLTVYRDTSEISRLNRSAFGRDVEVEPRLFELLRLAAEIHRRTGGAYDITSGPLSKAWGFSRRSGRVPDESELAEALSRVGSQRLQFNPERRTVRFSVAGMELNLGSIGKGYALDRCCELLEAGGLTDFLLHGGQSSLLARGSRNASSEEGWWIGVRDPLRPGERLGQLRLRNRALGTSGTGTQFFYHAGRRYGHILDPRTGQPVEGVLSSTVLARTAAEADALSTAFYVLGPAAALEYCRRHGESQGNPSALMVIPGNRAGTVEVVSYGLDEADWRPAKD